MASNRMGVNVGGAAVAVLAMSLTLAGCGTGTSEDGPAAGTTSATATAAKPSSEPTAAKPSSEPTPTAAETTADQSDVALEPMPISGKVPDQSDADQTFLTQAHGFMGEGGEAELVSLRNTICQKLRDDPTPARHKEILDAASGSGADGMSAETLRKLISGAVMSGCWDARTALPTGDLDRLKELAAGGPTSSMGEGVYEVGTDIKPGRYRTNDAVSNCYWEITKSGSNGQDIIANDNVSGGRPSVTIKRGQEFKSNRCGEWSLIG